MAKGLEKSRPFSFSIFMASFGVEKWPMASLVLTRKNAKKFVAKKSGQMVSFAKKSGQ